MQNTIFFFTFFYKINKGDLPLMYSILGKSPLFIL